MIFKDSYDDRELIISELKKNSEGLYKLLKNIIEKSAESSDLKTNAENSIKSIDDLISVIRKADPSYLREIYLAGLDS
jgi:hypothetical protein